MEPDDRAPVLPPEVDRRVIRIVRGAAGDRRPSWAWKLLSEAHASKIIWRLMLAGSSPTRCRKVLLRANATRFLPSPARWPCAGGSCSSWERGRLCPPVVPRSTRQARRPPAQLLPCAPAEVLAW